ncbi:MAG TPA: cyclase family protein [Holophaga sp.]|nr:cyclase family protein [Holophaga sp.]
MILDITAPLSPRLALWPGEKPFEREVRLRIADGDFVDLSSIHTTLHAGTHADAPAHIVGGAPTIDAVDLEPYLGPCEVVAVRLPPGARILPEHLPAPPMAPRVLFRTDSYPDPETFTPGFNAFSPELVDWLAARGCRLMGIDTPSVDPFESEGLESHRAIFKAGLRCLEGLRLGHVAPGRYFLSALPLRIEGGDGSPVRAVLMAQGD